MTDEQFQQLIAHLERIERYLSQMSGLVFVDEVPNSTHPIAGVVAPARMPRRAPNR